MNELFNRIETELNCSVCEKILNDPLLLPCGHSICYACGYNLILRCDNESSFDDSISEGDSGVALPCQLRCSSTFTCSLCQHRIKLPSYPSNEAKKIPQPTDFWPRNICLKNLITSIMFESVKSTSIPCDVCESKKSSTFLNKSQPFAQWFCNECSQNFCDSCHRTSSHALKRHSSVNLKQKLDIREKVIACWYHREEDGFSQENNLFCLTCSQIVCFQCFNLDQNVKEQHVKHTLRPVTLQAQNFKNEINMLLFQVSEKANYAHELINDLKNDSQQTNIYFANIEKELHRKMDEIKALVEVKREYLINQIQSAQKKHRKGIREKAGAYAKCLQSTTSFMHLTAELIKEPNISSFLQIAPSLKYRFDNLRRDLSSTLNVNSRENSKKLINKPELNIDTNKIRNSISSLTFGSNFYEGPEIIAQECSLAENNVATIKWTEYLLEPQTNGNRKMSLVNSVSAHVLSTSTSFSASSLSTRYILEMDDGEGGQFKIAYRGPDRICEIEGLQFGNQYRFRVKSVALNCSSEYSNIFTVKTPKYAKFTLEQVENQATSVHVTEDKLIAYLPLIQKTSPSSTSSVFETQSIISTSSSSGNSSLSKEDKLKGSEFNSLNNELVNKLIMANVGLVKGLHYWEFLVEEYDPNQGQLAFGIAVKGASKERMLGFDDKGWSMYMNDLRSWFLHNGQHKDRTDGGLITIPKNTLVRIGIRLDLNEGQLAFYRNGEPHGPIAFDLPRYSPSDSKVNNPVFYPAISLCPSSRVKLISGLEPPSESEESDEENEVISKVSTISYKRSNTTTDFTQNTFKY